MIELWFMCAMMQGSVACVPFPSFDMCIAAEHSVDTRMVTATTCDLVSMRDPRLASSYAPENAPLPPRRP